MYRFGLTGWQLEHSLSPRIHAAALDASGLSGEYRLYPTPRLPEGTAGLVGLLDRLRRDVLHGLNVTVPHKQVVIPLLDELTGEARLIGAVNLVYRSGNRLVGDNTDAPAFRMDLYRWLEFGNAPHPASRMDVASALVLGAGGAARAVAYALVQDGWQVHLAARHVDAARRLALDLAPAAQDRSAGIVPLSLEPSALGQIASCGLIVNATPVGMYPHAIHSPWPFELPLPAGAVVYDLVYNPAETLLVRAAREAGLRSTTGLGMLVEQAALSFERWTGRSAPRQAMHTSAAGAFAGQ